MEDLKDYVICNVCNRRVPQDFYGYDMTTIDETRPYKIKLYFCGKCIIKYFGYTLSIMNETFDQSDFKFGIIMPK